MKGYTIPPVRETWTNNTFAMKSIRIYAKKSLNDCSGGDAYHIAEITITLTTGGIIKTKLPKICRAITKIHLIKNITFHESETISFTSCLKISQSHIHDLC